MTGEDVEEHPPKIIELPGEDEDDILMRDANWCRKNPNFNKKVVFKDICLYKEPLMWPYI